MTLEDFFTLTEMKDGLTAPARVMELISNMQKEKDCVVKNINDATRQWSTVASTIAATENKDCLELFVQLDGLWFIDKWLKDAKLFSNDANESCVEESITALLQAIEKLQIDTEKSVSCGIWTTVKDLLSHNNSSVQDKARALFNSWKQEQDRNAVPQDVENGPGIRDAVLAVESGHPDSAGRDVSSSGGNLNEEKQVKPTRDETMALVCPEASQSEMANDVQMKTSDKTLDRPVKEDKPSDPMSSSVTLQPVNNNLLVKEEATNHSSEGNSSIDACNPVILKQNIIEGKSDGNEHTNDLEEMKRIKSSDKLGEREFSASGPLESKASSLSANAAKDMEPNTEDRSQNHADAKDENLCSQASLGDMRKVASEGKIQVDNISFSNKYRSTWSFKSSFQVGESDNNFLQKSKKEDFGLVDKVMGHAKDENGDLTNDLKSVRDVKDSDYIDKRSDFEFDYGMVDAIEVARQVAIEVEREVVDRREQSCSSSEKTLEGVTRQPGSPDSIHGKEGQAIDDLLPKEVPTGSNLSAEVSSTGEEEPVTSAENLETELKNRVQEIDSSQVSEATPELGGNNEKGFCSFDLNQEISSDDMDHLGNSNSIPISVVSASRAAAASGLPVAPLQFEGTLGWKGSAATSAFRPASPRRNPEGDKTLSVGGSSSSSKQRQDCLDFDLNMVESGDTKIADAVPGKQVTVSSGLPSVESSVEGSPRRSKRPKLDLNRISDDGGDCQSDLRMGKDFFQHRNGRHSPSPSSSASSMQPLFRNFDLNDQPSLYNDSSDQQRPYLGKSSLNNLTASEIFRSDGSVISIMGARVEVSRKDFGPENLPLPNGRIPESTVDFNLAPTGSVLGMGSALPYAHSPAFGYNGLQTGPNLSFSSAIYGPGGPIPYMVDSRGAPVVPQIMGSASTVPPSFSHPPFIMSMTGSLPGSNGAGPSRPSLDLNTDLMMVDGVSRDSGRLRQLFNHGQGRSMDEASRANLQLASSSGVVGGKRKEPDIGWEAYGSYPFNYKHQQSPWK